MVHEWQLSAMYNDKEDNYKKISSNNDAVRYQKESLAETKHLKTDI